jgi:hypothetical protein
MCGGGKPPPMPAPQAPPAPIPARDSKLDARMQAQNLARRAGAGSTNESTMLTGSGGASGSAPVASPTLGG